MRGMALKRPELGGAYTSLAEAGYVDIGLDAGYEKHSGVGGGCHTTSGHMIINGMFPDLAGMNRLAHTLNLTSSWYLNSDGCNGTIEQEVGPTYVTDAADAVRYGFDGVKFDSERGGPSHNITLWAMALKEAAAHAGNPAGIVIENCLDKNPTYILDKPAACPFNHYRTGPDNSPSFFAGLHHVYFWAVPYLEVTAPVPASRPNCWAYPDMLGIGAPAYGSPLWAQARSRGCANMTLDEERTLFANWAIISSPLILAIDVRNATTVRKYWPIVTNSEALRINSAWAGSAGTLLKESPVVTQRAVPIGRTCHVAHSAQLPNWLVYVKPLPKGQIACLAINLGEQALEPADNAEVTIADLIRIGGLDSARKPPTAFTVTDVWTGESGGKVTVSQNWSAAGVSQHNSSFVVFTPVV